MSLENEERAKNVEVIFEGGKGKTPKSKHMRRIIEDRPIISEELFLSAKQAIEQNYVKKLK